MAFPLTPVLDNFNTGATQALQSRAGWDTVHPFGVGGGGDFSTDSVPTKAVSITSSANLWVGNFVDSEAWFKITDWNGSSNLEVFARWVSGNSCYASRYFTGTLQLGVWTSNSFAGLATTSVTLAAGDSMGVSCVGSTISSWYKIGAGAWTLGSSAVNSSFASGQIGAYFVIAGNSMDSFGGGDISPASQAGVNFLHRSGMVVNG